MDQRKLILLGGAVGIALVTALVGKAMLSGKAAPAVQAALPLAPKGPRVLVAQHALAMGTIITADAVAYQEWPKDMVKDAYFVDGKVNLDKLVGTVVRFPITAGQPLTQGQLVSPGDRGFLAAALGPGMRAITITVSERSSVAGFVFPGDHVDLMLNSTVNVNANPMQAMTQALALKNLDVRPMHTTETIINNLRVLATDQSTENETVSGKTVVKTYRTVTLEVTPKIAEKIEVAQASGSLSLTLRSIADNQSDLDRAIASGEVKLPGGATKADEDKAMALIKSRPVDGSKQSFVSGGDVSRFERKYAPPMSNSQLSAMMRPPPSVRVTRGHNSEAVVVGTGGASYRGLAAMASAARGGGNNGGGGDMGGGMGGASQNFNNQMAQGMGNAGAMMGPAMVAGAAE